LAKKKMSPTQVKAKKESITSISSLSPSLSYALVMPLSIINVIRRFQAPKIRALDSHIRGLRWQHKLAVT